MSMFTQMLRFCKLHTRRHSTIFALSSGKGKCGVAVIRVSGSGTESALKSLTGLSTLPRPRTAILRSIRDPKTSEMLDKGLILWFPGPNSFTGEDSCEFHVHGGIAVINSLLAALGSVPNLRLAEPGEFTRRAFHNGKLDLTEVEGLADLLQAETELQRKQAFLQTQGALSKLYNKWRQLLVKSVAEMEAVIDFEETEEINSEVLSSVSINITSLVEDIKKHLQDGRRGELLRNGVKTVIVGEPNAGKSSFLNLLCKRPAAIVTPIAGTTRDVLEVTLNIGGYPIVLADTAGLRTATTDIIEQEGINRALENYEASDLVVLVVDSQKFIESACSVEDYLFSYTKKIGIDISKKPNLVVFNKLDLIKNCGFNIPDTNFLSCVTEEGVGSLMENLTQKLKTLCGEPSAEHPSMNQMRHRQHLTNCLHCLSSFLTSDTNSDTVLQAEHLRKALKHLGNLVGVTTTEQILDYIFKEFCIGK